MAKGMRTYLDDEAGGRVLEPGAFEVEGDFTHDWSIAVELAAAAAPVQGGLAEVRCADSERLLGRFDEAGFEERWARARRLGLTTRIGRMRKGDLFLGPDGRRYRYDRPHAAGGHYAVTDSGAERVLFAGCAEGVRFRRAWWGSR